MERVGDLDGVGHHRVEHQPVGARQVQGGPRDPRQPVVASSGQPPTRLGSVPTSHYIEQPTGADVGDRGGPALAPPRPLAEEQRLVEPQGGGLTDSVGMVDQGGAIGDDGVV